MSAYKCDCRNIVCLTTPRLQSPPLSSISASSVPPHPPTGSASFSVSPMVAPQLLCKLSWVTLINDNSRGFTDQAHPLHIPGRSAADLCSFWHLMHSTFHSWPFLPSFSSPLSLLLHITYGAVGMQPYGKCHKCLTITCAVVVVFLNTQLGE